MDVKILLLKRKGKKIDVLCCNDVDFIFVIFFGRFFLYMYFIVKEIEGSDYLFKLNVY